MTRRVRGEKAGARRKGFLHDGPKMRRARFDVENACVNERVVALYRLMRQIATSASRARRICPVLAVAALSLSLLPCALCPSAAHAAGAAASQASSGASAGSPSTEDGGLLSILSSLSRAASPSASTALSSVSVEVPRASMVFKISGDSPFEYPVFTFVLKADKTGYPMPADSGDVVKSCTLQGAGAVDFGAISVEKPGVYTYEISQEPVADAAWDCDASVYELKIVVVQKDDGLQATKTLTKDGQQQDEAVFTNSYNPSANAAAQTGNGSEEPGAQEEPAVQDRSVEVGPLTPEEEEAMSEAGEGGAAQSGQSGQEGNPSDAADGDAAQGPQLRPQPAGDGLGATQAAAARTSPQASPDADPGLVAAVVAGAVAVVSVAGVALATFIRTKKKAQGKASCLS